MAEQWTSWAESSISMRSGCNAHRACTVVASHRITTTAHGHSSSRESQWDVEASTGSSSCVPIGQLAASRDVAISGAWLHWRCILLLCGHGYVGVRGYSNQAPPKLRSSWLPCTESEYFWNFPAFFFNRHCMWKRVINFSNQEQTQLSPHVDIVSPLFSIFNVPWQHLGSLCNVRNHTSESGHKNFYALCFFNDLNLYTWFFPAFQLSIKAIVVPSMALVH